jgi:glycine/D-amino acid oxidase-like deaminating enzyme
MTNSIHVVVIGAGAFGGWTALHLLRRGFRVTLLDAWGPGNSRSSSGGETRIIRGTYGPNQPYTQMTARAFQLWRENEARWKKTLFYRAGVLWLVTGDGAFETASLKLLAEAGIPSQELPQAEIQRCWPQMTADDIKWAIFENESGFLYARHACQTVADAVVAEGGTFRIAAARAPEVLSGELRALPLADGTKLAADLFVFACGPWLPDIFPDVIGTHILPTKQDVLFFGPPAGDPRFNEDHFPVWIDYGKTFFYGIPGNQWRGFKVANDARELPFDPTNSERLVAPESIEQTRRYLAHRFPALESAPLVETRVCQYENTADRNLIIDRHPQAENCWIVGGGSGHGFKLGPAVGELVAALIAENKTADPIFRISRFRP